MKHFLILLISILVVSCSTRVTDPDFCPPPASQRVKIMRSFPHDSASFTQGLFFYEGGLYESSGRYGKSTFRKVDLETGKPLKLRNLKPQYFGEGAAVWRDKMIQLTWHERIAFHYDAKTFAGAGHYEYQGEGWGLTANDEYLIMSDGSEYVFFRDPDNFKAKRKLRVKAGDNYINRLNELEWIDDEIWANVWEKDIIVRINPITGCVKAIVDASGLLSREEMQKAGVLNGIAYEPKSKQIYLTGKLWPKLFQVSILDVPKPAGN